MDPYTRWFILNSLLWLSPAAVLVGAGLWVLSRSIRRRSRPRSIAVAVAPILVGLAWTGLVVAGASYTHSRIAFYQRLGLPPPTEVGRIDTVYAERELLSRISPGVTTREGVHDIMTVAEGGYDCPTYRAEKYLYYDDEYAASVSLWDDLPPGVNVYYRDDGVVDKLMRFYGYIDLDDSINIRDCTPLSEAPGPR